MEKNLANYRKVYDKSALELSSLQDNPIHQFQQWFDEVDRQGSVDEANAMSLSTVGEDGYPKTRIVLLKQITAEGFIFFTNYDSDKGVAIAQNPKVSLTFFWPSAERQVIIIGEAEKISAQASDEYFYSRPKGSQLGAMVSPQSKPIPNREFLENELAALTKTYENKPTKRPSNWGGYLIKPVMMEFWQGRPNRLHDRFRYQQNEQQEWKIVRLAP